MENSPKKRAYTKSRLIKELAFRSGITQNQSRAALEAIIEIAYREAKENFFVLPGLCKFDVVHRNARNVRNPVTGEMLVLPPREALHVTLSKRAKETVAPRVAPMKVEEYENWKKEHAPETPPVTEAPAPEPPVAAQPTPPAPEPLVAAQPTPPTPEPPAAAQPTPPAPEPPAAAQPTPETPPTPAENGFVEAPEITGDQAISFKCRTCGQEVIAPLETVGYEAECPACGAILIVPQRSEPGTTYAADGAPQKEIITTEQAEDLNPAALKNRTIRIDTIQFDEAGKLVNSPSDKMLAAMKSRTMRIDLPDEF